jgi:hypothetical protein
MKHPELAVELSGVFGLAAIQDEGRGIAHQALRVTE